MKKSVVGIFNKRATCLALLFLSCVLAFSVIFSFNTKNVYSLNDNGLNKSYRVGVKGDGTQLDDLWEYNVFDLKLLNELMSVSTGIENATIDDLKSYINTNGVNFYDSIVLRGEKINENIVQTPDVVPVAGIVVRLKNLDWMVTSYTLVDNKDGSTDVVATLYLVDAVGENVPYNSDTSHDSTSDTPSNMYSSSEIRQTIISETGIFKDFLGDFGSNFLVQPKEIKYQHKEKLDDFFSSSRYNNESLDKIESWVEGENCTFYFDKPTYAAWGEDLLWLPSFSETGVTETTDYSPKNIWGISRYQIQCQNINWLRTAGIGSGTTAFSFTTDGKSNSGKSITELYGLRPAMHFNLTKALKNAKSLLHDTADVAAEYDGEGINITNVPAEGKTWYDAEKLNLTYYDLEGNEVAGYTELGTYKVKAEIKPDYLSANPHHVFRGAPDTSDPEHLESDTVRWFDFTVTKKRIGVTLTTDARGMPTGVFKSLTDAGTGIYTGDTEENGRAPVLGLKYKGRGSTSYAESTTPPMAQGTYTATAYIVNADGVPYVLADTYTIDFEIIKTLPTYSATDINIVYGTDYTVNEATTSDGAVTLTYYAADGTTVLGGKPTDVGSYKAKVATPETANYSAGEKVVTITITIATPTVNPVVPEKVYYHEGDAMPSITLSDGDTDGVIAWAAGSAVELGPHTYTWNFTPTDTRNYEGASGEIQLNFLPVALGAVKVEEFTQSGVIYAGGDVNALKAMLKVAAYNNDGTKNKDLTDTEYTLSGELTVGEAVITVHYSGFDTTFKVTVTADALSEVTATFTQGNNEVYPTTDLDTLKRWLTVTAVYASGKEESVTDYTLSGTLAVGTSEITVSYNGKSAAFNVNVTAVAVREITAVFTQGANVIYTSTPLDDLKQWLVVTAYFNNQTSETLTADEYTLTGKLLEDGSVILVSYGGKSASFTNVNVTAVVITELTVTYTPSGKVFAGAALDSLKNSITVKATYNDGSKKENITDYALNGDLSTAGTKTVTVSYEGLDKEITVTVEDIALTGLEVTFTQGGAVVYEGSALDALKPMLNVKTTYSNGDEDEDFNGYTLEGDLSAAGNITVTVKAGDLSKTFTVTVTAVQLTGITATFTQGGNAVYPSTELNDLKQWLTVNAEYNDASKNGAVSDYTLSGTLAVGTSEITVSYGGKTAVFDVTVTAVAVREITAVFTQGDNVVYTSTPLNDLKQWLTVTAEYTDGTDEEVTEYALNGALTKGTAYITVSFGGKTASFTVEVTEVVIVSIEVTFNQSGTVYSGASLDSLKKDITVKAVYNDKSENDNYTGYTLEGDLSAEGTKTVTVICGDLREEISVEVSGIAFTDISVTFKQNGNVYAGGDINEITRWLTVKAVYSDGSEQTVTDYFLSGAFDRVGDVDITVSYNGKDKTVTVRVSAATVVTKPSVKNASIVFDGEEHGYADFVTGFESNIMEFAEQPAVMKNVGDYTLKIKIKDSINVAWDENGDRSVIELNFAIETLKLAKPESGGKLQYTGAEQIFTPDGLNEAFVAVTGNVGTEIDEYAATASLKDKDNTAWQGGGTDDVSFTWNIVKKVMPRPTVTSPETIVYTGAEIDVTGMLDGYDPDKMSVSGDYKGTNANTYTVTVTLKDAVHYEWADELTRAARAGSAVIEVTWEIQKAKLVPEWSSASGVPTFTVPEKFAELCDFDYIFTDENGKEVAKDDLVSGKKYKVTAKLKDSCKGNFAFVSSTGEVLATPEESAPYEFMPAGTTPVTPPNETTVVGGGMKAWQFWVLFGAIMLNALILLCKKTGVQVNVGGEGKETKREENVVPKGTRLVNENQFVNPEEVENDSSLYAFEARDGESVRTVSDGAVVFETEKLTFAQEYETLPQESKDYLDGLKKFACENSAAQVKEGKFSICVGSGAKQVVKLGIKNGTVMAMFRLEDPRLAQLRRSAEGADIKTKETLIPVTDEAAYETAKQMITLRVSQIAEDAAAKRQEKKERLKVYRDVEGEAAPTEDENRNQL